MKIRMLETRSGSPDAHVVYLYAKGAELDLPQSMAAYFIKNGWAESLESSDFNDWLDDFINAIRK